MKKKNKRVEINSKSEEPESLNYLKCLSEQEE